MIEIAPEHFTHGGTRNLLMNEATGARVAFLTQDSEPAEDRWLECLLGGFELAPDVGIVYGPYRPRPDATPAVRMELERWFTSLAPDGAPRVDRLTEDERSSGPGAPGLPVAALIGARGFYTDANACVARVAWQRAPFREVAYAEDRVLAIDMLRAGYAKAYVPGAAVGTPMPTRPPGSCAAALTSGAGCARSTAGASRPRRRISLASCAASWAGHGASSTGRAHPRPSAARRSARSPVTMSCASPGRCWARAPIGCPRVFAADSRWRAAHRSSRSTTTR